MPNTSHNTRHLEGCTSQGTSKDTHHSTSKDAHIKETEGYAIKAITKAIAKVTFRQRGKTCYNEFLLDQIKYSATLHPGRARLKAS